MLKGRLFLRYFLLIAYIGVAGGMILGLEMLLEERVMFGILFFIVGIIAHFIRKNGYYVSIFFNSLGLGVLLPVVMEYFDFSTNSMYISIASVICLLLYIGLVYVASSTWKDNIGWTFSIFGTIIVYFGTLILANSYSHDLLYTTFLLLHVGLIYMITLMIVGVRSEDLLHHCSVASFILLIIAIAIGIIALIAAAMGDNNNSRSSSSRKNSWDFSELGYGRSYRGYRRRYYYHNYFLYDAYYFHSRGRRNDVYSRYADEEEMKRLRAQEEERKQKEQMLREEEAKEIY